MMKRNKAYVFGLVLVLCSWWLFFAHYYEIGACRLLRSALLDCLLDSVLISAPFFVVGRKWRKAVWVIFPLLTILFEVNIIYYRNFAALPGLGALNTGATVNTFTIAASLVSFRLRDVLLIFGPLAVLIITWFVLSGKEICKTPFPKRLRIATLLLLIMSIPMRTLLTIRRHYQWCGGEDYIPFNEYFQEQTKAMAFANSSIEALENYGFPNYLYTAIKSRFPHTLKLSDADVALIQEYLRNTASVYNDSLTNKNLVILIVESLNSSAITPSTTPFICSILPEALYAEQLTSQIQEGGSSDGQFIINTGLLPLRGEALVAGYCRNDFPGLPKALPDYTSIEFIGSDSKVWNQNITSGSYGYDSFIDKVSYVNIDADSVFLERLTALVDTMPEPYIIEATTVGMHTPYHKPHTTQILSEISDPKGRNYLSAVAAFDRALERFITALIESGRYANTVIAITGDHPAPRSALPKDFACGSVPLIILNAGTARHISEPVGQIDIYPTLLDIMGSPQYFRGVGQSLLGNSLTSTSEAAWEISEMIIRSRSTSKFLNSLYTKGATTDVIK